MQIMASEAAEYKTHYDLVYPGDNNIDLSSMKLYKKLPIPVGFARSSDVFPSNTKITIRTLEGDVDTVTSENTYLMIGILGEVYPIRKERFEAGYHILEAPYSGQHEYTPVIINRITGQRQEILPYARSCVPTDEKLIRGVMLTKPTKVFTEWDLEKYYTGVPGDWLAINEGSYDDYYIIRGDIFAKSYAPV